MKIIIIVLATIFVSGAAAVYLGIKARSGAQATGEPSPVHIETVSRGELVEIVSAPGQVQPRTKVQISARVAARIVELPFDEGDRVTKGSATTKPSMLVKLDTTEMDAQLRATEARANAQKASLAEAE